MLTLLLNDKEQAKLLAVIGQPMPMIFSKAQKLLKDAVTKRGPARRRDQRWVWVVKELVSVLDTVSCPWCGATGIAAVVQQVDPA